MTYEYKCDRCGDIYYRHGKMHNYIPSTLTHSDCPKGERRDDLFGLNDDELIGMYQLQVTGGVGTIFTGAGWTPRG